MAEHSLPDGKRWIANLVALGRALGYLTDEEYNVAPEGHETAPADVVWLRSETDRFPLFIFEVESRPAGQMLYNAAKVFSQKTELFEKPLFHFHLVVRGGQSSGRALVAEEEYGKFNYRVFRLTEDARATSLVCDVLSQHRRVDADLDVPALAGALEPDTWSPVDREAVWRHAEACGFQAQWEVAYAQLAHDDPSYRPRLVRRLASALDGGNEIPIEQYAGASGRACAPLLHAAIMALLEPDIAARYLQHAMDWYAVSGTPLAPAYGVDESRDDLVFAQAPAIWAAIATAIDTPEARSWTLDQLALVLGDPEPGRPTVMPLSALSAIWMLHVARAGGDRYRSYFERARDHLVDGGGVSLALLQRPPGLGGRMADIDGWDAQLQTSAMTPPTWDALVALIPSAPSTTSLLSELLQLLCTDRPGVDGDVVREAIWSTTAEGQA